MKISKLKDGTIKLKGDLIVSEIETIYHDIEQILDDTDAGLMLDLSDIGDIDTAGLQLLVAIKRSVEEHAPFHITNITDDIRRTMRLSGFDMVFKEVA